MLNLSSYQIGPVLFISLDCGEDKPDSDYSYFGLVKFEDYRLEQKQWLEELVETERFKNAPFKVVVIHIPPKGTWHSNFDIEDKLLPPLKDKGIDLMVCGHTHRYEYIQANKIADFPILINDHNSYLHLEASESELIVSHKGLDNTVKNSFKFRK